MLHVIRKSQPPQKLTLEQVNRLLLDGELSGDELAWRPGMEDWAPLHTIPEVHSQTPPPLPPDVETPIAKIPTTLNRALPLQSSRSQRQSPQFDPLAIPPPSRSTRVAAFFVDALVVFSLMLLGQASRSLYDGDFAGFELAFCATFLLIKDGLVRGASLGKLLFGLVVIDVKRGNRCGILRSCWRNAPIIASWALACVVIVFLPKAPLVALLVVGLPFAGFASRQARTVCDEMGGTYVVDAKAYDEARRSM